MTNEKPQIDYAKLLQDRKFDPAIVPGKDEIVLTIQDKTIGTLQNYAVVTGLAKAGKSSFISAIAASAFLPDYQDLFGIRLKLPADRKKIGYFDTESSHFDFYRSMQRIRQFAMKESHPANLDAYSFREDQPGRIRRLIETYLNNNPDCAVLFVDGLLDLCLNYNDEVETRRLTNWFKRITKHYNCFMVGVLHTGKGAGETLGHLGSNTDRWAQSTMIVEKNKETRQFIFKPKFLRSSDDFSPIALASFDGKLQQVPYEIPAVETYIKKSKKQL